MESGKILFTPLFTPVKRKIKDKYNDKHKKTPKERKSYFDGAVKTSSLEYTSWMNMINRCTKPGTRGYNRYGGRGITVCEEWMFFEKFVEDMGRKPSNGHSIERRKNSLGYFKENCFWADVEQQSNNRRDNRVIEYRGESLTVSQWAKKTGMSRHLIMGRLNRGWSVERVFNTEIDKNRSHKKVV